MLEKTLAAIVPLNEPAMAACQLRLDNLTKPLNSLLCFEQLARQLAGITGQPKPSKSIKKSLLLLAGPDANELEAKKTAHLRNAVAAGLAPVSLFAAHVGAPVAVADITAPGGPLTRAQVRDCLAQGILSARLEIKESVQVLGLDALTSSSDAAGAALINHYREQTVSADEPDPLLLLEQLGDPVLCGLTGAILGAAAVGAAVVLDGVAADAAALLALQLAPQVKPYLIGSHLSAHPAHQTALDLLGLPGRLDLQLAIGQGVGAALGMVFINAALHVINDMRTFGEAGVAVAQDGPGALKQSHAVKE